MSDNTKLFLSVVSSEFLAYRELLTQDLKRPTLDVAVQEDFVVTGGSTLEKLDDYMVACDGIIHLIGKASGAVPEERAVAALLAKYPDFATRLAPLATRLAKPQPGFSYTQWEAYLALYHERPLFVYRPTDFDHDVLHVPRAAKFVFSAAEQQSQKEHYARISALGHDRGQFLNEERLSSAVLRDLVEILPRLKTTIEVSATKLPHNAERLIGRDPDLARLDAAWNDSHKNVLIVRALGGMGKTSLVATWMAELALKNWRGAERVFDWSFYSQGTRDQTTASAETFIAAALREFGDPDPTLGSAWDRGARLANLIGKGRCLLVLDGLEPLQYPPGAMGGKLKDAGIESLLKGLAAHNAGLCIVTTREKVPDIQQHYGRTAEDLPLTELTDLAGAALLHFAGATRAGAKEIKRDDKELQAASHEVRGHGLTLQLLGKYLALVEHGDIRKRDTVRLAEAEHEYQNDATRPYGHAFKAIEAYEHWFEGGGETGRRELAVLRLLGLFDRPASPGCLHALRQEPVIAGLTETLAGVDARDWRKALSRLGEINLLVATDDGTVDCHPLIREFFAMRLRAQPEVWKAAHRRLYEHLCATTQDKRDATLEDLQPLYQAVAHGGQAGLQQEAWETVFYARVVRGNEKNSKRKLGAFGSDLGAIACFFETPWKRVSSALTENDQSLLFDEAAFSLRALGRLTEALEPMQAGLEMLVTQDNWKLAATSASNLSELELTLGEVAEAVREAEQSVTYADRSRDAFWKMSTLTTHADALHQAGRRAEAEARFREVEQMQAKRLPAYPLLFSLSGFQYCDLLLTEAERAAWRRVVSGFSPPNDGPHVKLSHPATPSGDGLLRSREANPETTLLRAVSERAAQTLKWATDAKASLLTIALDHLTLGRAALYAAMLQPAEIQDLKSEIESAVSGLRRAGHSDELPKALLTRAWQRSLTGPRTGPESAQSDLDEACEIAERGPMPLFLADIHLYRARLFFREAAYPWESPQHDLAEARRLIEKHGYLRRMEELVDAEGGILHRH